MTNDVILVTGATGKTGRRVTQILRDSGREVREGSRSSVQPFNWTDETTWGSALLGVDAVYVVLADLGSPEIVEPVREFARQAAEAGATRAVMVSVPASGGMGMEAVLATESAFVEAGLALTVLRLRWFHQNFTEDFLLAPVMSGDLRLPAGDGREAFVDADDIAEVAVAALTEDGHAGRSYEVTGPATLSFAEVAAELSRATGREIRYTPVSVEEFVAEQVAAGVPAGWAQMLGELYAHIGTGALDSTSDDVELVLGRPARDLRGFSTAAAAAGAWADPS